MGSDYIYSMMGLGSECLSYCAMPLRNDMTPGMPGEVNGSCNARSLCETGMALTFLGQEVSTILQ
jgi:hypothetical protein